MKILQINAVYGSGSTGVIVRDIQTECISNGIECICASSSAKGKVEHGYHIGNRFTNKLHALLTRISGKQGYFSFCSTWKFLRFLDACKPDIVHLHNLHSSYINLPMLLKYLAKKQIRTIVTLHDCWFYTGGCTHYTAIGCDRWKSACGQCPKRYEEFPALLWDSSAKQLADRAKLFGAIKNLTVVGVSKWITAEAKAGIFRNANCITIPNGIDTDFFRPVQSDFRKRHGLEGKFVILAPANKWLLPVNKETLEVITGNMDEDMAIVFFGGIVPEGMLGPNMVSLGFIHSREELRDIYCAADVMVNCTREDTLPTLMIEAQACGTPVIAYGNTGVKETVGEGCGYVVENGNAWEMLDKIRVIKREGKEKYSKNCQEIIRMNFDKRRNYRQYVKLYNSITNLS